MDNEKLTLRSAAVQVIATFSIAFPSSLSGLIYSWPSYNVVNFVSNDTVLSEPMTSVHISLLGSVVNIGVFGLTPVVGWIVNKIGRKYIMICIGLPYIVAWTTIYITNSVHGVIIAMAIGGCGPSSQVAATIYIAEIAQTSIRGALTSSTSVLYYLGVLTSYVIGGYLSYYQIVYLQLGMAILNIMMLSLLKDSPVFLLQKGMNKEAAESLAFYRQTSPKSKQIELELYRIKLQLDSTFDNTDEEERDSIAAKELLDTPKQKKLSGWQFLKQSPSSKRAFITAIVIAAVMILMGNMPMLVYAETLFSEAVPSYDPNKCSIWLAVDFVAATLMCALVVDRVGRKFLTIFTCMSSSICTVILGTLIQIQWAPEWFTILVLYLYNFLFNMGISVIPYVLIGEYFLPEVRSICGSFTISIGFGLNFIGSIIFTFVMEHYGFAPIFYGVSVVGFAGAIYAMFYMPETNGLSVAAIQKLFTKKTEKKIST